MCISKLKCQHRDGRVNLTCDELYLTSLEVIELNLKRSGKHCTASNTPENCISEASSEFRRLHDDDVKEGEEARCGCAAEYAEILFVPVHVRHKQR